MSKERLLAGEFGAAARLSPKALRLYAEQGLLVPASCDAITGYRYYAADQLPRARLIARLRRLGLPLARIGHLADLTPEARAVEVRGWLRSQRDLLEDRVALAESIDRYAGDAALTAAIAVRDVPAVKLVCRAQLLSIDAMPGLVRQAKVDIRAHLRGSGLAADGPVRVTFPDLVTRDTEATIEVAIACDGPVEPAGDLYVRLAAAHRAAYLPVAERYLDYPMVLHVYDALEAWIDADPAATFDGHPYEVYPGTAAPFDVVYPI